MTVDNKKFFLRKANNILLFLFVFILPTQFGKHFFFDFSYLAGVRVDYLAPTLYLIDIIVILLAITNYRDFLSLFRQKKFLIFLLLISINILVSQSRVVSIYQSLRIIEWLVVFNIFSKQKLPANLLLVTITIMGVIQLGLGLLQISLKHSVQGIFYFLGERYFNLSTPGIAKASFKGIEILRPYGSFSHPNSLAGFYLLLYLFVLSSRKFNKHLVLKYFFCFISILLVFLSFSKITIIALIILTGYNLLVSTKIVCRLCSFTKIFILLTIGLIFLQPKLDPLSVEKRIFLINNSWQIIRQFYLLGVGAGNYLIAQSQLPGKYLDMLNQPVHNLFFLSFSEFGLIGITGVFYLIFPWLKKFFAVAPLIFVSIIITGFFDHYWLTLPQNFFCLAWIFGSLKYF